MTQIPRPFLSSGQMRVGCNYWASHAGAFMWRDWQPEIITQDFAQLQDGELKLLRVFPLWPDFQPLHRLATENGNIVEYRFDESPLPDTAAGQAGVDEVMLERFRWFADEAHRHGLELIVGLVTGWMSGRIFTPPAFTNLNVITDPEALRWEGRFVRCLVETFRDHPAIVAWDLGNECNVMGLASPAESWLWTHTLAAAIRAADSSRPVVSGMHSLAADPAKPWAMKDQGELTDFLTTHPYPIWTAHCDQEGVNTLRPQLHGTVECLLSEGVGGKPAFVEEMGSMGPFIVSDELAPEFLRPALFSLWAHDCRAMLWWCAYDQNYLESAPYDWIPVEQELGLYRADRSPKPLIGVVKDFARMLEALPFAELPQRLIEAVCLVSPNQDQWGVAQNAFLLAKQAGVDLTFQWSGDALRDAEVYLLPSIAGTRPISRHRWQELLTRVKAGATLYVSLDTAVLAGLDSDFGVKVLTRSRRSGLGEASFLDNGQFLPLAGAFRLNLETTRATVLAAEADGNPIFTRCELGKGQVFFLTTPLEKTLTDIPGAYQSGAYADVWQTYARVFASRPSRRVWRKSSPLVAVTEHPFDADNRVVILINHSNSPILEPVCLEPGWKVAAILHGSRPTEKGLTLENGQASIVKLERA